MAAGKDKLGRPVVVVTGLGVVTSLGAGKSDNWANLQPVNPASRPSPVFPPMASRPALPARSTTCRHSLVRRTDRILCRARRRGGHRTIGARQGRSFPGPLFLAVPPIEMEWPQRLEIGVKSGANDKIAYADMLRVSAKFPEYHRRFLFGSVADNLAEKFRYPRLADFAIDRLRLGSNSDPARCRQ